MKRTKRKFAFCRTDDDNKLETDLDVLRITSLLGRVSPYRSNPQKVPFVIWGSKMPTCTVSHTYRIQYTESSDKPIAIRV